MQLRRVARDFVGWQMCKQISWCPLWC